MQVLISIIDNFLQKQTKDIIKLEKTTQCNNSFYTVTLSGRVENSETSEISNIFLQDF